MTKILRDRVLSFPWYQPWVRSKAEAETQTAQDRLPLVYSWNEVTVGEQLRFFTVSVNTKRMAELLEPHLPQAHPAFGPTCAYLADLLATAQTRTLRDVCVELRSTPSLLTAQFRP